MRDANYHFVVPNLEMDIKYQFYKFHFHLPRHGGDKYIMPFPKIKIIFSKVNIWEFFKNG